MRIIKLVFLSAVLVVTRTATLAADGGHVTVRAILVIASNQPARPDPRLAPYEPTLRRILRFESYRFEGEGSAGLAIPGKGTVAVGRGQALDLESEKSDGKGGVHLRVRWHDGGRTLMNTGLVLRPGVPAVLGGPSAGREGEVSAVILVAD